MTNKLCIAYHHYRIDKQQEAASSNNNNSSNGEYNGLHVGFNKLAGLGLVYPRFSHFLNLLQLACLYLAWLWHLCDNNQNFISKLTK